MTELDAGNSSISAPTIGAEALLPFGGVKQTGNGPREGGREVYDFYSETKVIYVDFSGKLQRAQIDTEARRPATHRTALQCAGDAAHAGCVSVRPVDHDSLLIVL